MAVALPAIGAYHDSVPDHQPRWRAEVRQAVPRSNLSWTVIPAGCRNPVPWMLACSEHGLARLRPNALPVFRSEPSTRRTMVHRRPPRCSSRSPTGALLGFDRNPGQRRASSGFPALRVSGQDGLTTHPASPSGRNLDRGPRLRPTGERHRTVSPVRRPLHATKTTRSPRLQPWRPQTKAEVLDSLPGHASDGASGGRLGDFRNTGDHPL